MKFANHAQLTKPVLARRRSRHSYHVPGTTIHHPDAYTSNSSSRTIQLCDDVPTQVQALSHNVAHGWLTTDNHLGTPCANSASFGPTFSLTKLTKLDKSESQHRKLLAASEDAPTCLSFETSATHGVCVNTCSAQCNCGRGRTSIL